MRSAMEARQGGKTIQVCLQLSENETCRRESREVSRLHEKFHEVK